MKMNSKQRETRSRNIRWRRPLRIKEKIVGRKDIKKKKNQPKKSFEDRRRAWQTTARAEGGHKREGLNSTQSSRYNLSARF